MYWEQRKTMRVNGEISSFKKIKKIKRGFKQEYVLSPDLFFSTVKLLCET